MMKYCSNCGEKLVNGKCPNCKPKKGKITPKIVVSIIAVIILSLGGFYYYKGNTEERVIESYPSLFADSHEEFPADNIRT
ncbi:hypothetical protein BN997_00525 [Oceanobacillus oncorhynchi]|uniref:Uncharacterized protein n=1 Tax=Oceanobacillus oncorhynchi TaxID=545501 RepID=A0A0A1MNR1_9BACI|nr:hypothetical protein BN997_00525 [Oceanobacillus oncorhynchi]